MHKPGGGRSGSAVGSLHATGAGRSGVQVAEKRPGPSADLPSIGASCRSPYPDRFSGLLPDGDAEAPFAGACSRLEPPSRAGETGGHPDARRLDAYHRWSLSGDATLHRAGSRLGAAAPPTQTRAPQTTPAPPRQRFARRHASTQNVVQTLAEPPLKTKGFPAVYPPNCESRAKSLEV